MTTTFALVPGAGGDTWFWHRLVAELESRGHRALPVELPAADDSAGLDAYADTVVGAIGDRSPVVLVAQSMGGLTAPLVCDRVPVDLLVLVNAMVPLPGETGGEWWTATGQGEAQAANWTRLGLPGEPDDDSTYFHDVPADVVAAVAHQRFRVDAEALGRVLDDRRPPADDAELVAFAQSAEAVRQEVTGAR